MSLRNVAIATSTFACAALLSFSWSEQRGVSLSVESVQAGDLNPGWDAGGPYYAGPGYYAGGPYNPGNPQAGGPTTQVAHTIGLKFGLLPRRRPQLRRSHTIFPPMQVAPTTGLKFGEAGLTTQVNPTMQVEATT